MMGAGLLATVSVFGFVGSAESAVISGSIYSPVDAVIDVGGPGGVSIIDTINQSGLSSNFISGVTDFDTYIASNPTHTFLFRGNEWFSNIGTNSATVTYDLGQLLSVESLALWNEEVAGIGTLDLLSSNDGVNFTSLASNLSPTNNPPRTRYSADVFSFSPTIAQFIRFEMSNCPQPGGSLSFDYCAIGEVAFKVSEPLDPPQSTPEPSLLFGFIGLSTLGLVSKKNW